jgi:hypothetical protein
MLLGLLQTSPILPDDSGAASLPSSLFRSGNILFSLIVRGLVVIVFQPLHDRPQRAVNRLMNEELQKRSSNNSFTERW